MSYSPNSIPAALRAGVWMRAAIVAASVTAASMVTVGHVLALSAVPAFATDVGPDPVMIVGRFVHEHVMGISAPGLLPAPTATAGANAHRTMRAAAVAVVSDTPLRVPTPVSGHAVALDRGARASAGGHVAGWDRSSITC